MRAKRSGRSSRRTRPPATEPGGLSAPGAVVGVGHRLQPFRAAAESDVDLHELLVRRAAVPVLHVRPRVVALARSELADALSALLRPHPPFFDEQQLTVVMRVPVGAGTGIE